mgnify:FL=1
MVLVATIRALKYNGGVLKDELSNENLEALKKGIVNLEKHIENLQKFGVPVVVTLNAFVSDTEAETAYVEQFCKEHDCEFALAKVWEKGGEGGIALANKILETLEKKESHFHTLYSDDLGLKEKIETVAKENLRCRWSYLFSGSGAGTETNYGSGYGKLPGMYGKDTVFPVG